MVILSAVLRRFGAGLAGGDKRGWTDFGASGGDSFSLVVFVGWTTEMSEVSDVVIRAPLLGALGAYRSMAEMVKKGIAVLRTQRTYL
jgi:hypothetical protein